VQVEKFEVANVKCGGCVTAIKEGLLTLAGVHDVQVDISSGQVEVEGDNLSQQELQSTLADLGYPVR